MLKTIQSYNYTNELWIISCFFNSNAYITKPTNYNKFIEKIEASGLNYLIVECAFGNQPFTLKKSKHIIQIRTNNIMWQKERLLNIAIDKLPVRCKKIAWVDCDVLFENPDWARETAGLLKHYKVVQPFKEAVRLPKGEDRYGGKGERYFSFGYIVKNNPIIASEGKFELHGHTGFAWASHKSIFKAFGLYDVCIAGTADHLMSHAFVGDWDTKCVKRIFGNNLQFYSHYELWAKKIFSKLKSSISYTDGKLLHLWHGDIVNREYTQREKILEQNNFNPAEDLVLNKENCWSWTNQNHVLEKWAKEYFVFRKED